jgi:hypothetical protein
VVVFIKTAAPQIGAAFFSLEGKRRLISGLPGFYCAGRFQLFLRMRYDYYAIHDKMVSYTHQ